MTPEKYLSLRCLRCGSGATGEGCRAFFDSHPGECRSPHVAVDVTSAQPPAGNRIVEIRNAIIAWTPETILDGGDE